MPMRQIVLATIATSNASGSPLGQSTGLALAGSLASSGQFGAGIGSANLASDSTTSSNSSSSLSDLGSFVGAAAVPKPSAIMIAALALVSLLGFGTGRRRMHIA